MVRGLGVTTVQGRTPKETEHSFWDSPLKLGRRILLISQWRCWNLRSASDPSGSQNSEQKHPFLYSLFLTHCGLLFPGLSSGLDSGRARRMPRPWPSADKPDLLGRSKAKACSMDSQCIISNSPKRAVRVSVYKVLWKPLIKDFQWH